MLYRVIETKDYLTAIKGVLQIFDTNDNNKNEYIEVRLEIPNGENSIYILFEPNFGHCLIDYEGNFFEPEERPELYVLRKARWLSNTAYRIRYILDNASKEIITEMGGRDKIIEVIYTTSLLEYKFTHPWLSKLVPKI